MRTKGFRSINVKSDAVILHLDGDIKYARKAYNYYNSLNIKAVIKNIAESRQPEEIRMLLNRYKPDILVSTGHDLMIKKGQGLYNMNNYRNSKYFVKVVKEARKWNPDQEELIIFAGACESFYEAIISEGANFASSPERIMIDYKEPLIVASMIALTPNDRYIGINDIIPKLTSGNRGIGGGVVKGRCNKNVK